jgi:hypothetical protein
MIEIKGACEFRIDSFGGAFDVGATTKRAKATAAAGSIHVGVKVEGVAMQRILSPPDDASTDLTFGRAGGGLELECLLGPCWLRLDASGA